MNRQGKPAARENGMPVRLVLLLAGLSGLLFAVFAEELGEADFIGLDRQIGRLAEEAGHPAMLRAMVWITELGSVRWISACLLALAGWLFLRRRPGVAFWLLLVTASSGLLTTLIKLTFRRPRPAIDPAVDAVGYSFPSGHASAVMAFYGFVIYLLLGSRSVSPRLKGWAAGLLTALILLVGASRVFLEAHFPSDVIAGYSLGLFCLLLGILGMELQRRKNEQG